MSLKSNVTANYLGQGWTAFMSLALIPIYIKFLGIEAYGLIGLFALVQIFLAILDMGMTPMLSREMARFIGGEHSPQSIRNLLRSMEFIAFLIAILIGLTVGVMSSWIATDWLKLQDLSVDTVAKAFIIMGWLAAMRMVEGIYRSCIIGLQRQVIFNIVSAFLATVRGLGAVATLAWVSSTIEAFFFWQAIVSIVTIIAYGYLTYYFIPKAAKSGSFSLDALKDVWKFSSGMIMITLLAILITQLDKILLSRLLSLSDYGYYSLAAVTAGGLYLLVGPITQAWFPRISQLHAQKKETELVNTYHLGAQLVTAIVGSAAVMLIVFSETILTIWTKDIVLAQRISNLVSLLAFGNFLNALNYLPYQTQLAYGWTRFMVKVNCFAVIFIVPAILLVVPIYGELGAAGVWIALNIGYVFVSIYFMHRKILIGEKLNWYLYDIALPLVSISIIVITLKWIISGILMPVVIQLSLLVLGGLIAVLSAFLTAPLLRDWLVVYIKNLGFSLKWKS